MAKTTDELFAEATEADYETAEPVTLAASDTEEEFQFRIDEHLRTIAIPEKGVVAGVEGDLNVNIARFTMTRYYHGRDLSKLNIRINYRNANGQVNYYTVSDATASGDSIIFSWEFAADVTQYKGNVQFVVYLFSATNAVLKQRFFTTLGTLEVLEGLEVDSSIPVSEQTDILLHLKKDLSAYAEEVKKSLPADYTAMTEQVSSLKEDLEQLPNYSFYKNYAFEKRVSDDFGNQANITLISGLKLPIGTYYVYAKFSVTTSISNAYARMYVSQAKFSGKQKNINGSGDYVLSDTFTVSEEKEGTIRLDINQLDNNRHVHINSLIIVNFSDEVVKSIDFDDRDRKTICSFKLEKKYYPDNIATTEYVDNELNDSMYKISDTYQNLAYEYVKTVQSDIRNNVMLTNPFKISSGEYFVLAKVKIENAKVFPITCRFYIPQENYSTENITIEENGEHLVYGKFNITDEKNINIRLDILTNDGSKTVSLESMFVVKNDDKVSNRLMSYNNMRKCIRVINIGWDALPNNVAKTEDVVNKKEVEILYAIEPLFDLVKDFGNRNRTICLIGDSTSDGKAGPAIGIYTALSMYQKSGEILDGVTVIDRGSNGSTAEAYIGSYKNGSGSLYTAIQDNADVYVVCLGINDVRQGLCDKETLKQRITFIVDEILNNTKGRVILRTPNSLGSDDTNEKYIKPYTSSQEYTDILWESYNELKNYWDCTRVRSLDMQTLVFGRKSIPSATNPLMGDVLHPNGNASAKLEKNNWKYGMNIIGMCIAYALGYKEKPNAFEIFKAKTNNPTNPYMEYPLILESNDYATKKIYTLTPDMPVKKSYIQFFEASKETILLKKGDILKFGNEFCKIYNGETLQNVGALLHIPISFTEGEIEKSKNVWHVSVYRLPN